MQWLRSVKKEGKALRSYYWKPIPFRGFLKTDWIFRLVVHKQFASIPETEKGLDWLIDFVKDLIKIKDTKKKVDFYSKKLTGFSKTKEYEDLWED